LTNGSFPETKPKYQERRAPLDWSYNIMFWHKVKPLIEKKQFFDTQKSFRRRVNPDVALEFTGVYEIFFHTSAIQVQQLTIAAIAELHQM
jgi:hypothetical protein